MNINKIIFSGNAGRDAEIDFTKAGKQKVYLSLAHTKKHKDQPPTTTWMRVMVVGAYGDTAAAVKRGDRVIVEGEVNTYTYKDKKTGEERSGTSIFAYACGIFKWVAQKQQDVALDELIPPLPTTVDNSQPFDEIPF